MPKHDRPGTQIAEEVDVLLGTHLEGARLGMPSTGEAKRNEGHQASA